MDWLADLFGWLDERVSKEGCDGNSLRHTREFLRDRDIPMAEAVEWLQEFGGFCDCEVLLNVPVPDDPKAERAAENMVQRIMDGLAKPEG